MRYPPVESSSAARAILSPTGGRANSHWVAFAAGLLAYSETSGSAPCHAEVTRAVADADGYCRQRTNSAASTTTEGTSELSAPEGIRTPNLLIRRHGPMVRPGATRVPLSCRWRCREARLSSSLSSELSSAHGAKQRHPRFLTHLASYPAARNYAIPTGVIGRRRSSPFQPRCPCTWQTIGSSMSAADDGKLSNWPVKQS